MIPRDEFQIPQYRPRIPEMPLNTANQQYSNSDPVRDALQSARAQAQPQPEKASQTGQSTQPLQIGKNVAEAGQMAGSIASDTAVSTAQDMAKISRVNYEDDIARWKEQGLYWFDPNSDVLPDIDYLMSQMPSSTDSLSKGSISKGKIVEPIAAIATAGGMNKKQASYISEQAGLGAAAGSSMGGWIGAVAGSIVGTLKGVFTWKAAQDEDKEQEKKARAAYLKAMEVWMTQRRNRARSLNRAYDISRGNTLLAGSTAKRAEDEAKNQKAASAAIARRQQLVSVVNGLAQRRSK